MGRNSAAATSAAKKTRNSGVSTLPTQVRISPEFSERTSTARKNRSEKTTSTTSVYAPSPNLLFMPMVKETAPQRGIAKNGPMVR